MPKNASCIILLHLSVTNCMLRHRAEHEPINRIRLRVFSHVQDANKLHTGRVTQDTVSSHSSAILLNMHGVLSSCVCHATCEQ